MSINPLIRLLLAASAFLVFTLIVLVSNRWPRTGRMPVTWQMSELSDADAAEQTPRHFEYWGGYSIAVPSGWKVRPDPNSSFQLLSRLRTVGDAKAFDTLTFSRIFTSDTHQEHALDMVSIFEANWHVRDVEIQDFQTNAGLAGTEFTLYGHNGDGREMRIGMFYLEVGEVIINIGWLGPSPEIDSSDTEIRELVATLEIENSEPAEQFADGFRRYDEPLGGFSCVPPAGWAAVRISTEGPFLGYLSPDLQETLRSISVGRNPSKSITADEYCREFLELYAATFDGNYELLERQPFYTEQGLVGERITSLVIRPSDCVELRTVLYLFQADEGTLECQCANGFDQGDMYDAEYDAFARSLRIETPPFRKASQKKSGGR
jgi:hypothetical protein